MKKVFFSLMAFVFATAVFAQKKADDIAKFNTETFDFGKVKQNVPPTATFIVTNIGTAPLIIETATPTCGCTVSDYTKAPIAPGKTGYIKATYNAAAVGPIHKTLTVKFAGVDEIKPINLAGEVLEPAAYDTWAAANKGGGNSAEVSAGQTKEVTIKSKDDGNKLKSEVKTTAGTNKLKVKKGKKVVEKNTAVKM